MLLKSMRLPLENKKYSYVEVAAEFTNGQMEIHIIDRAKPRSGVSILQCIEEVQNQIITEFGAKDFAVKFLVNSRWFLYGKNGKVGEYRTVEGVRELQNFDPILNKEFVTLSMERSGLELPDPAAINLAMSCEQLTLF